MLLQLYDEQVQVYARTWTNSNSKKDGGHNGGSSTKVWISGEMKLYKLSLLFQNSEQDVVSELALRTLDDGSVEKTLMICR